MAIDYEYFKEKLLNEKRLLEEERANQPSNTTAEFNDEIADRLEEQEERQATNVEVDHRYKLVLHALRRLEEGTYGLCEISGEPIETERLEANPAARTAKAHLDQEDSLPIA